MTVSLSRTNRGEPGVRSPTSVLANNVRPGDRSDRGEGQSSNGWARRVVRIRNCLLCLTTMTTAAAFPSPRPLEVVPARGPRGQQTHLRSLSSAPLARPVRGRQDPAADAGAHSPTRPQIHSTSERAGHSHPVGQACLRSRYSAQGPPAPGRRAAEFSPAEEADRLVDVT